MERDTTNAIVLKQVAHKANVYDKVDFINKSLSAATALQFVVNCRLHIFSGDFCDFQTVFTDNDCSYKRTVKVYDSLYSDSSEYADLQAQLDYLYSAAADDNGHVKFQLRQPQRQQGTETGGLFAVANAFAIAIGQEPEQTVLDETKMRQHLIQCLHDHFVSPFPCRHALSDSDTSPALADPGHVTSPSNTGEKYSKVAHCTMSIYYYYYCLHSC